MKRTLLLSTLIAILIPTSAQSQTRQLTFPLGFAVDFGKIHVLTTSTQLHHMNVAVKNTGTAPVTITSAALTGASEFVLSTGPFTVSGPIPFPVVLQPGQVALLLYVHFLPTQAGVRTASLMINSDATGSPHTISLRAEAVDTPLGPWPWTFVGPPLGARYVNSIDVDPDDENVWYVTSMSGLYITRDGGASWEHALTGSGINGSIMGDEALAIDPTDTRRVYAALASKLYGSTDKGRSWAVLHTLALAGFGAITVGDNGTVYTTTPGVSGENPGIHISEDFGASWNFHSFGVAVSFLIPWDITRDPVSGTLYVVTEPSAHPQPYDPPLLRSLDNGVTWQDVSGSLPWHGVQVQVDPQNQDVYVLLEGPGVYRSSNLGLSWEHLSNKISLELEMDESHRNRFYGSNHFSRGGGAFASIDGGRTFNHIGLSTLVVGSMATNSTGTKLYAAVYGGGIFVTSVVMPTTPQITQQPASRTVPVGGNATFTVSVTGTTPLVYQWQKNGVNIPGATSASYTTPPATMADHNSTYRCRVTNSAGTATSNSAMLTISRDFDGDGKADLTVFRPSNGTWYVLQSGTNYTSATGMQWGNGLDKPVAGDYDGDGRTDIAVFRPSNGIWYLRYTGTGNTAGFQWGSGSDVPVAGDYDGDGKTDIAVFRPSNGTWYLRYTGTGNTAGFQWGNGSDVPVPGDYNGDGKTDIAVFRPSNGTWYLWYSGTGTTAGFQWGNGADVPVPGDYNGDGKADVAVFRPSNGTWYLWYSGTGTTAGFQWGGGSDTPVPGDYDGDGKTDLAVFRPSNGVWYLRYSSTGTTAGFQWGNGADIPILNRP